jgi:hypothetical protein
MGAAQSTRVPPPSSHTGRTAGIDGALVEVVQAAARHGVPYADAVVGDIDDQIVVHRDGDQQFGCSGVTDRVADGFPHYRLAIVSQGDRCDVQRTGHAYRCTQPWVGGELGDGTTQRRRVGRVGQQVEDRGTNVLDDLV